MEEDKKHELEFLLPDKLEEFQKNRFKKIKNKVLSLFKNELYFILNKDQQEASYYIKSLNRYFTSSDEILLDFNSVYIGEVYKANLLLTFSSDTAYVHPILILGKITVDNEKKVFAIPGTSNGNYAKKAYHKTLNPLGDKNFFYIPKEELKSEKNTTFLVNNAKVYPIEAIIESENMGDLYGNKEMLIELNKLIFENTFPYIATELRKTSLHLQSLQKEEKAKYIKDLQEYYKK